MTTHLQRRSATIYNFAERARAIHAARGHDGFGAEQVSRLMPNADFGGGWYHEAAIRETDRTRKS